MAQEPPASTPPPAPSSAPPPPGPEASRAEWHAWRRMYGRPYRWGGGPWFGWGFFWPALLIVLGVYFLLSNLGLLSWLRADVLFPVLLILFGVALLVGRGRWRR